MSTAALLAPEGRTHAELVELVFRKAPAEAVGLLTDDGRVIELVNGSSDPETNFAVSRVELIEKLSELSHLKGLTLWHSHPGGGVGPSRTDMQQRIPHLNHLVITLVDDDVVYSYY